MIAYYVNLYEKAGVPEIHEFEAEKFENGFVYFKADSILETEQSFAIKAPAVSISIGVGHFETKQAASYFIKSFLEGKVLSAKKALDVQQELLTEFENSIK